MDYVSIEPAVIEGAGLTFGHTQWLDVDHGSADRVVLVGLAGSLAEERGMGDADPWARSDERRHVEHVLKMAKEFGKRNGPATITSADGAGG